MNPLQQIALVEALLSHWDAVRMRLGAATPALLREFEALGQRLLAVSAVGELARVLDDLLELARGTAADAYVRELVRGASLGDASAFKSAETASAQIGIVEGGAGQVLDVVQRGARALGTALARGPAPDGAERVPVLFATNRESTPTAGSTPGKGYGGELADETTFGVAWVSIPAGHRQGRIEAPRWWDLLADARDTRRFFVPTAIQDMAREEFEASIEKSSQAADSCELLVFLHGFNVSFEEAAMRAAQFASDANFSGLVLLFSWPSAGRQSAYAGDEERAECSAEPLAEFLRSLEQGPWKKVHLLAHSMGNRPMLGALADHERARLPLGEVVFTAADVYLPTFRQKFPKALGRGPVSATSYATRGDLALRLSRWLHGQSDRLGLVTTTPFVFDGLETVDASVVGGDGLGHGYWSSQRSLITDLRTLLLQGLHARERGLDRVGGYWAFPA